MSRTQHHYRRSLEVIQTSSHRNCASNIWLNLVEVMHASALSLLCGHNVDLCCQVGTRKVKAGMMMKTMSLHKMTISHLPIKVLYSSSCAYVLIYMRLSHTNTYTYISCTLRTVSCSCCTHNCDHSVRRRQMVVWRTKYGVMLYAGSSELHTTQSLHDSTQSQ